MSEDDQQQNDGPRVSRRALLGIAGVAGGGVLLGAGGYVATRDDSGTPAAAASVSPFHGDHQAGVATKQQKYLHFAAYDLAATSRDDLRGLMRSWTQVAAELTAGGSHGIDDPQNLTITFGFGTSLFDGRFGLAAQRPPALADIPAFKFDKLDPAVSGGDLCVQVCSDDRVVAMQAASKVQATAGSIAAVRWAQEGFLRDPLPGETTTRNLFGFKDGTNNLDPSDDAKMHSNVWVNAMDGPSWMTNGTYLVSRRILMQINEFLPEPVNIQEMNIGRQKGSGAPIGQKNEFEPVDPSKELPDSHIMMANQRRATSEAERILRRGYNFTTGYDDLLSSPTGGLFFIAIQRDPRRQFVSIQTRLSTRDRLTKYIVHQSGALFAVPPGVKPGGYVGETLLA
ncbi:MAG: deferrochelatase/peroxidase EfeB [Gaiellales bacterium]|nr:deferrochelatase/peroxidase EfeB [Gaiellales bacterium]